MGCRTRRFTHAANNKPICRRPRCAELTERRKKAWLHSTLIPGERLQVISTKLVNATLEPMYMTPEQFGQRLKSDYERYGKLMKQIGVVR